jgi:hypothetical protein
VELENVFYGGVQLVHNFGAAAVIGLPVAALRLQPAPSTLRKMAWLTLVAWLAQAASGAGFGTVSFLLEGELPQIHHVALGALCVKIGCAALGIVLLSVYFLRGSKEQSLMVWRCLAVLGATALSAAAVLRWFS